MIRKLFIVMSAMYLSACLYMGESAAIITAELLDENQLAYTSCSIDLLVINGDNLQQARYSKRKIDFNGLEFKQIFIIKPGAEKYSVEIICDDSVDMYRSQPLDLSTGVDNPVNLGSIVLKRKP